MSIEGVSVMILPFLIVYVGLWIVVYFRIK